MDTNKRIFYRFSLPVEEHDLLEAAPGELAETANVVPGGNAFLGTHLSGDCSDKVRSIMDTTPILFPFAPPPIVRFEPIAAPLSGYNATADLLPATTYQVGLKAGERDIAMAILSSGGADLSDSQKAPFLERAAGESLTACVAFSQAAMTAGYFTEPLVVIGAIRLSGGGHLFCTPPFHLHPNPQRWRIGWIRGSVSETAASLEARILRRPFQLTVCFENIEEIVAKIANADGETAVAYDIFVAPASSSTPPTTAGSFARFPELNNSPGWEYSTPKWDTIINRLADPGPYSLAVSIPIEDLRDGSRHEIPLNRNLLAIENIGTFFPDYDQLLCGEARLSAPVYDRRLLLNPILKPAIPYFNSYLLSDSQGEDNSVCSIILLSRHSGQLHASLINADAESVPDTIETIFSPDSATESVVVCRRDGWKRYYLTPLRTGGAGFFEGVSLTSSGDGTFPLPAGSLPLKPLTEDEYSCDGELRLLSPETAPVVTSEGRLSLSSKPLTGIAEFPSSSTSQIDPLLVFARDGIALLLRREVSESDGVKSEWQLYEWLSDLKAKGGDLIVKTRQGVAFCTDYGIYLQRGSTCRRLSPRGDSFPTMDQLIYHREADILELLDTSGSPLWRYDLEEDRLLPAGISSAEEEKSDRNESGESTPNLSEKTYFQLTTRPFRLPSPPKAFRIFSGSGVGNEPDTPLSGETLLEGSRDLRNWAKLAHNVGQELNTILPSKIIWYRLTASCGLQFGMPLGFEVEFS